MSNRHRNDESGRPDASRRLVLKGLAIAPIVIAAPNLLDVGGERAAAQALPPETILTPTPACLDSDDDDPTPAQTEGPYFKPRSPERRSLLETGVDGTRLLISGLVITRSCKPVARALLDFWQADDGGEYDNLGFRLRGHQYTDAAGAYRVETIVPGLYPGRTRHIHVKVQAPDKPILTTQLYFPGESRNARDGIYRAECLLTLSDAANGGGRAGRFNFVLNLP